MSKHRKEKNSDALCVRESGDVYEYESQRSNEIRLKYAFLGRNDYQLAFAI